IPGSNSYTSAKLFTISRGGGKLDQSTRKRNQMKEIHIRKMKYSDINHVMEVEKSSFTSPWTKEIFYQEIEKNSYAHYFVVESNEQVIGYAGMWIVVDDAQIT